MNSSKKLRDSARSTRTEDKEALAKLHCVHHLFAEAAGEDPYYALSIKNAIDETLREEPELDTSLECFSEAAWRLFEQQPFLEASYGLYILNLTKIGFDPLFIRESLLAGLRQVAGYEQSLVVVKGLRQSVLSPGGYFTRRSQQRYTQAIDYIDTLACEWTTPATELTLLYY